LSTATKSENLRERALKAHADHEQQRMADRREKERQELERRAARLQRLLREVLGVDVECSSDEVTVGGLRFTIRKEWRYHRFGPEQLVLVRTCGRCGEDYHSRAIQDLATLGAYLSGDQQFDHRCPTDERQPVKRQPTASERLLEALYDVIAEEVMACCDC